MGLLTPVAIRVGSFEWLPPHLPKVVKVDDALQKVTRGRTTLLDVAGLPNVTMLIPDRKSGIERTTTVLGAPLGPDWLVAGSYFGGPKTPAWVFNLRAAEEIRIETRLGPAAMRRSELTGDERSAAWAELLAVWPNFELYERRTTRVIPVFRLTPASGGREPRGITRR